MDLFANDLSIHGQFHDAASFRHAFARMMAMRAEARRFGREVHCHRMLLAAEAMPGVPMQRALQRLSVNERRSAMRWLTHGGPFWDEDGLRRHGADDYLECRDEVVTDRAVGEAAYRTLHGMECALVSFTPSDWNFSPVEVTWRRDDEGLDDRTVTLENWRDAVALEDRLRDTPLPVRSWDDLRRVSTDRFGNLTFAGACFDPLAGAPFVKSAADRILVLLDVLDRFARAFDADGARTPEGHRLYRDHFTGIDDQGAFSDSSDKEKRDFRQALTFPHPDDPGKSLFCTWHGKVRHPALRLHFSWPVRRGEPVYVVYAGPKLTKR